MIECAQEPIAVLQIRDLRTSDLPLLKDFAPPEWKVDLSQLFGRHFGRPYFHPLAAEVDGRTVGCADGLVQGNAGWLGNIIVLPEFRGHGIGRALTETLVAFFKLKGVQHQILVATPMGEPIYRKLGFETVSQYVFFENEDVRGSTDAIPGVRPLTAADHEYVFALDRLVTGEFRSPFLRGFLEAAWAHVDPSGNLDGYYLPQLGNGLVIASSDKAGLALMQHRLSQGASSSCVAEQNTVATEFLRGNGFVEAWRAPRMALGPDLRWQPQHVYCRGSGYCG